jgi:hypothetical protein
VSLFTRKAPEPPAPAQLPVLYEPAVKPSAAPKAGELEKQIRSVIWQHIGPELARSANLSLPELIDWISGATRLSNPQIEALARKMGLLDTPETGVDVIRARLQAVMRKRPTFDWLEWPGGGKGEENLRDFAAGANGVLTVKELNFLAREFFGKVELDPQTAMLRSNSPAPTSMGRGPDPYDPVAEAYPPRVILGQTMRLYSGSEGAENKPARLQRAGWS